MLIEPSKDIYFSNCVGVFQGGGCKAIAYIGAYEVAYEHGIIFSELAGTSAGSIFAALIALGATPEKMKSLISEFDFTSILELPTEHKPYHKASWYIRQGQTWLNKLFIKCLPIESNISKFLENKGLIKKPTLGILFKEYGFYDSSKLVAILKGWFEDLTGLKDPKFRDISRPLHIVSGDVRGKKLKIWNREETPDESIARAVAASCCIPIFFTPLDKNYVDGGLLCNRPDLIFDKTPNYFQALSFSLGGEEQKIDSFEQYLFGIINTVIEGADEIQHRNMRVTEIEIPYSGISATDFGKINRDTINQMIEAGKRAMSNFFIKLKSSDADFVSPKIHLYNSEQVYSQIAFWSLETFDAITVASENLDWVWLLFPTIVKWAKDKTRLLVYFKDLHIQKNQEEWIKNKLAESGLSKSKVERKLQKAIIKQDARTRFLDGIGAKLKGVGGVAPQGFYFEKGINCRAILFKTFDDGFKGKLYAEELDSYAIKTQLSNLGEENDSQLVPLEFINLSETSIISKLSQCNIYNDAKFQWVEVPVRELRFLNEFLRGAKYKQIIHMFNLYPKGTSVFSPGALTVRDGKESVMGPIVVEEHDGQLFVIDGNTRCLFAYKHNIDKLVVLKISCVKTPLPTEIGTSFGFSIDQLVISEKGLEGPERYAGFDYKLFRQIEQTLRPDGEYLK
ncbi:MAG: patatin-like phospholipase family protein [Muribaculum sp.]|nr:patatin-like phospholipase family protein [Muribaculum sp.]